MSFKVFSGDSRFRGKDCHTKVFSGDSRFREKDCHTEVFSGDSRFREDRLSGSFVFWGKFKQAILNFQTGFRIKYLLINKFLLGKSFLYRSCLKFSTFRHSRESGNLHFKQKNPNRIGIIVYNTNLSHPRFLF
ncbi:MAG: hypothetical protein OXJ52_05155 [Oligoflexia bacterium]|nr:hypothetical protein [Oligoflexia bacterium]